jgi:hypothetical protein
MHAPVVASRISTASHLTTLFMTVRSSISLKGWSGCAQAVSSERKEILYDLQFPDSSVRHDQKPEGVLLTQQA